MTVYLVSTDPGLVFAAEDRTAAELRSDVESWVAAKRMMTVAGVDAAGDEVSTVVAWGEITEFSISEHKPESGGIVLTDTGED